MTSKRLCESWWTGERCPSALLCLKLPPMLWILTVINALQLRLHGRRRRMRERSSRGAVIAAPGKGAESIDYPQMVDRFRRDAGGEAALRLRRRCPRAPHRACASPTVFSLRRRSDDHHAALAGALAKRLTHRPDEPKDRYPVATRVIILGFAPAVPLCAEVGAATAPDRSPM